MLARPRSASMRAGCGNIANAGVNFSPDCATMRTTMASATQTARSAPGAAPLSGDAGRRRCAGLFRAARRGPRRRRRRRCAAAPCRGRRAHADQPRQGACPLVQDKGAALLIDGHVDLVARAGADGAHLTGMIAFNEAIERAQARAHRRRRRPHHPPRRHARGRSGRRLCDVRRARRRRRTAEPSTRSKSASPGGRRCSRSLASPMPQRRRKWRRW